MLRRMLRSYERRLAGGDVEYLPTAAALHEEMEAVLRRSIQAMRQHDPECSWARIGKAFGITRQAAQQRWGRRGSTGRLLE